jgi:hypothetical protein
MSGLGIDDVLRAQVEAIKAQIVAYNGAILAFAAGGIQSYTLESGQTRQQVTRADLSRIQGAIDSLMNQLTTLEARLCGSGATHYVPSW